MDAVNLTPEEVRARIEARLRALLVEAEGWVRNLPLADQQPVREYLAQVLVNLDFASLVELISASQFVEMANQVANHLRAEFKKARDPKPHHPDRDGQLVKLRADHPNDSWKETMKKLRQINPNWDLTVNAAKAAFRREMERRPPS
jgi:hypothetical protein